MFIILYQKQLVKKKGRPLLSINRYSSAEILSFHKVEVDSGVKQRLLVIYQLSLGKSSDSLTEYYQVSAKQIRNWAKRFEKDGVAGLVNKKPPGKPSLLSAEQQASFRALLSENPEVYGYNTQTWTGPLLRDWIEKQFNISYKRAQIYNILQKLGFSYQKGKGIYPEAAPEIREPLVAAFKKK